MIFRRATKPPPPSGQPQNFSEWFEIATWYAPPSSRARIRPIVEADFAKAVQAYVAKGLSEAQAQSSALADLPDAHRKAKISAPGYLDTYQPENFSKWLDIATATLVPSAKARVRPEIEAHYAEAVQAHLQNGLPESAAQDAALTDLGHWRTTLNRYRQEYPTTQDIGNFETQIEMARGIGLKFSRWVFLVCLFLLGFSQFFARASLVPVALYGLLYAALGYAASRLARRKPSLAVMRKVSWLGTLQQLSWPSMIIISSVAMMYWQGTLGLVTDAPFSDGLVDYVATFLAIVYFGITVFSSRDAFRLRKKLAAANEDDLPPPDPSTA